MHKNKLDTILNLCGISLGLTLTILIIYHIQNELSYDRHFTQADRLFRVTSDRREGDNIRHWATTSPVMPEYLTRTFSEIESTCRLFVIEEQIISAMKKNRAPHRVQVPLNACLQASTELLAATGVVREYFTLGRHGAASPKVHPDLAAGQRTHSRLFVNCHHPRRVRGAIHGELGRAIA